jgi:predicted nucleic acid-binding protein
MSRLDAVLDERRSVDECLPMARALFGEQVEKALELLNRQFNMVRISAEASAAATNSEDSHSDIWDDLSSATYKDRPNKMNVLIAEQVKLIEDTLVPVLRLDL